MLNWMLIPPPARTYLADLSLILRELVPVAFLTLLPGTFKVFGLLKSHKNAPTEAQASVRAGLSYRCDQVKPCQPPARGFGLFLKS